MWTLSSLGALERSSPPSPAASGALQLLREAKEILKDLNGEDDKCRPDMK